RLGRRRPCRNSKLNPSTASSRVSLNNRCGGLRRGDSSEDTMSNKNDKKLFDLLNTVQGRVVGMLALVGALIGGYKLCRENPTFFAYTMIGVIVCLLWLKLFFIRTSKRLKSTIPKKVYESPYTPRQLRAALSGLVFFEALRGLY